MAEIETLVTSDDEPPATIVLKVPICELAVMTAAADVAGWKPAWLPSSSAWPLKFVALEIWLTSWSSCVTSAWSAERSVAEVIVFAASMASERMRCRMLVTVESAPSATFAAFVAS